MTNWWDDGDDVLPWERAKKLPDEWYYDKMRVLAKSGVKGMIKRTVNSLNDGPDSPWPGSMWGSNAGSRVSDKFPIQLLRVFIKQRKGMIQHRGGPIKFAEYLIAFGKEQLRQGYAERAGFREEWTAYRAYHPRREKWIWCETRFVEIVEELVPVPEQPKT